MYRAHGINGGEHEEQGVEIDWEDVNLFGIGESEQQQIQLQQHEHVGDHGNSVPGRTAYDIDHPTYTPQHQYEFQGGVAQQQTPPPTGMNYHVWWFLPVTPLEDAPFTGLGNRPAPLPQQWPYPAPSQPQMPSRPYPGQPRPQSQAYTPMTASSNHSSQSSRPTSTFDESLNPIAQQLTNPHPPDTVSATPTGGRDIHVCEYEGCNRSYKRKSDLKKHRRKHIPQEEYEYTCSQCKKKFLYKKDLKRHRFSHESSQQRCPGCGHLFRRPDHLSRHQENNCPQNRSSTQSARSGSHSFSSTTPARPVLPQLTNTSSAASMQTPRTVSTFATSFSQQGTPHSAESFAASPGSPAYVAYPPERRPTVYAREDAATPTPVSRGQHGGYDNSEYLQQ